jgi:hypothetical protein
MEDNTCAICAENFNRSTHKPIKCQYCTFVSCCTCCRTYLLGQPVVKCMNTTCNKEWTRKYIRSVLPLVFINKELRQHREKLLFDQERALMPATQPAVEYRKNREPLLEQRKQLREEILKLKEKYYRLDNKIYRLDAQYIHGNGDPQPARQEQVQRFTRACPSENCRGFLNTKWICGLCNNYTCSKCHIVKGPDNECEHTCNADDVATAELLNQDTKPCPSCGMGIFRITGCDQMYCTECHTAFDWRTGQIETENIHNPHYFEWMARQGTLERNPNDFLCGREINTRYIITINSEMDKMTKYNNLLSKEQKDENLLKIKNIVEVCRNIIHIRSVEIPRYRYNHEANNREIRILYMMNSITEDEFKRRLHIQNKKNFKNLEIRNVFRLAIDTLTDIIYRFDETVVKPKNELKFDVLVELDEFKKYLNECFADISHTYGSKKLCFNSTFALEK